MFKKFGFLIGLIVVTSCLFAKESFCNQVNDTLRKRRAYVEYPSYPLTKYTSGSYPLKMEIEGVIVDVTPLGYTCGVVCGCGTVKIALTNKIKGYDHDTLFVAMPCFSCPDPSYYLNKRARIKLKVLTPQNKECYWNQISQNRFDSHGIPFYIPEDHETLRLK
ncbi:MAG: hypothetical protein CFE21_08875 [Bacteroidetes bacterium B1(2017)]|nr:MAG: hypothetical protein CFE21_08875 [Bacteroidetes bacterium B1(2017)]